MEPTAPTQPGGPVDTAPPTNGPNPAPRPVGSFAAHAAVLGLACVGCFLLANLVLKLALSIDGLSSFTTWPLRAVSMAGFGLALLALLYSAYLVIDYVLHGHPIPGYTTIVVGLTLLSGIQLIALGVLGEYVSRIFEEVKARPLYVVRHRSGRRLRPEQG